MKITQKMGGGNYSVFQCDLNIDLLPDNLYGQFSQCLLRLVLQHCLNPLEILQKIYKFLPEGGRVFVIEEDDAFFKMYPDCPAFNDVVSIWKRVCENAGTARYMGSQVPKLLNEAGFNIKTVKVLLQNNYEVGPQLIDYFIDTARLMHKTNTELVSLDEILNIEQGFNRYLRRYGDNWFAVYPEVITIADKP